MTGGYKEFGTNLKNEVKIIIVDKYQLCPVLFNVEG